MEHTFSCIFEKKKSLSFTKSFTNKYFITKTQKIFCVLVFALSQSTYFPILSTSSIRTSGFSVLVFFRHWITFPGIAPTYVRRCPFISATSVIPPTENLKYSRFKARAIERAKNKHYRNRYKSSLTTYRYSFFQHLGVHGSTEFYPASNLSID